MHRNGYVDFPRTVGKKYKFKYFEGYHCELSETLNVCVGSNDFSVEFIIYMIVFSVGVGGGFIVIILVPIWVLLSSCCGHHHHEKKNPRKEISNRNRNINEIENRIVNDIIVLPH